MIPQYEIKERLLGVEGLVLNYGSKRVLNNVNIDVRNIVRPGMHQGQIIALLGLSGCGKTQLFRCLAGLNKPTAGRVVLRDLQESVRPGDVGVVQQAYPLLNHRTVLGNLMMAKKATEPKAIELLTRFGLLEKRNSYPVELSGGQRQRVAIMQQLLMGNHFLLMDEPFSGLDIVAKANVCDIIKEVTEIDEENTVIFTTHDIEVAVGLAQHVWIMSQTKDEKGNPMGATITHTYDLIQRGIAWQHHNFKTPQFFETVTEIKDLFKTL